MLVNLKEPDIQAGVKYWAAKSASLETVLGGFDKGVRQSIKAILFPVLTNVLRACLELMP